MKGARYYAELFKTGQIGKLYLVSGSHARGKTFQIFVLPEGAQAIPNGANNPPLNIQKVEVFGVISGNPGWNEEYGWIHKGQWVDDFEKLVKDREQEIANLKNMQLRQSIAHIEDEQRRSRTILDNY